MGRLSLRDAVTLRAAVGSAEGVMEHRHEIRDIMSDASDSLVSLMSGDLSAYERRADEEWEWCEANGVRILTHADSDYPCRLRECPDAPMVLFTRGGCDLNASHIINIVGTRKSTPYGKDVTDALVNGLAALCPDVVVVSGLAYGTDINAHRAALRTGIATVGVVAHGQDRLYPPLHRPEAEKMVGNGTGAVVTEFFHGTRPEARNFLQRNRIIAGISDATVVVESASHGGSLVTARLAQDYGREVFAVPGMVNAEFSKGCNSLIREHKAVLVTSAEDIVDALGWQNSATLAEARLRGIERTLFPELTQEEQMVVDALRDNGDSQSNALAIHTGLPIGTIVSLLFSLEMKGVVTPVPGNTFHLVG